MKRRSSGEGSAPIQRADGRWQVNVSVPGEKRKSIYAPSREEALEGKNAFLRKHLYERQAVPDGRETVAHWLRQWLEHKRPEVRSATYRSYRVIVERHLIPELGAIRLARLAPRDVKAALVAIQEKGLSPRSVGMARQTLHAALKQAVEWEMVPRNVATVVRAPRVEREEVTPLSVAEAQALIEGVAGDRLEALYIVAVTMGLRIGELLGLRWIDVDFNASELRVRQTKLRDSVDSFGAPKSRRGSRSLTMPAFAAEALWRRQGAQRTERKAAAGDWVESGLVFTSSRGTALDDTNVRKYFYRHLDRLELPRVRFHDLRHSAASLLLAKGVPMKMIQEVLGHSSYQLTADTYSHVLPALKQEAADAMDSLFSANR